MRASESAQMAGVSGAALLWGPALEIRRAIETDAHFLIVSCAGETCAACEWPLWCHVETTSARYCPTDGRPFWRMAMAVLRAEGHDIKTVGEVCQEIIAAAPS